ncbi:hypothetical protein AURANDRAFT_66817 [Aureococcus anophagefferens]|uniref:Uncharacterized protein n=1 Tax=Aureococcus anophagefferens TaxID=44056 RepID=F0YIX3_AURAN|nr:hypothetical protein AURANDRAFT_66817 [Aureococcus anophagefferens]EGB04965.1 hypothetical protein AURANDRAFT_66817 [Aureococcus anophagefferens]|eukprot:XP_009040319.1 hypothetical protein AURANDRAFT_66817 [Aureococcus anophagefferens]
MYYDARATGESCDDGLVEVDIDVADYYYPPDGAVQLIPAHNVYNYCAVIDNPELYSKSGLEKKAHPNYLESRAYEFNERACAKILKSCVGDDAYDGSQRQKQVAAAHARNPAPTLARDGPAVYYPWRAQLSPPRCVECGREGVETRLCMCANEGSGLGLLGQLATSALRKLFPDGILPGEAGYPEVANCELLTGASTVKFLMDVLRAMTGLGSSELDAMLSRTVTMRIRKTTVIARETHFDHIVALSLRYAGAQLRGDAAKLAAPWRLDEDPAWVAGAPNGATRRVSRMEGLQLLLRKANLDKGTTISRDIVDDLLDYNTCFYAPSELAKPDVLDRTYRAESDILKRVKGKKGTICRAGVETDTAEVCVLKKDARVVAVAEALNAKGDVRLRLQRPVRGWDETYRVEAVCRLPEKGDEDDDDDDDLGKAVLFSDTGMKQRPVAATIFERLLTGKTMESMKIHPNAKDVDFFCFGSASILAADGVTKMAVAKCRAVRGSMLRHYAAADFRYAARFVVDGPVACPTFATGLEDLPSQPPPTMVVAGPQKDQIPVDPKVFVDYPMSVGRYQERALVAGDPRKTSLYPPGDEKLAKYEADGAFQPWLKHLYDPWTGDMRAMPFGWTSGPEAASMRGVDLRYFYDESKRELVGTVRFSENALEAVFDGSKGLSPKNSRRTARSSARPTTSASPTRSARAATRS